MSRLEIQGFMKESAREGELLVGARGDDYQGPVARVSLDEDWLWIITDDYEGSVMLNRETLPFLQKALQKLIAAGKPKR